VTGDGYRKSKRHVKDYRRRRRAAAALAEETWRPCRFNSPGGSGGEKAADIGGDGESSQEVAVARS
jgi:hypothetical protein